MEWGHPCLRGGYQDAAHLTQDADLTAKFTPPPEPASRDEVRGDLSRRDGDGRVRLPHPVRVRRDEVHQLLGAEP